MIQFRNARQSEKNQIKQLWHQCFHDEESYIDMYLESGFASEQVYVAVKEDEVVAMMQMIPVEMIYQVPNSQLLVASHSFKNMRLDEKNIGETDKIKGRYVYAVATKESARGQGLMRKLENFAVKEEIKKGAAFFTLVPASKSLFSLYNQIGYTVYTNILEDWFTINKEKANLKLNIEKVSIKDYVSIRNQLLEQQTDSFIQFVDCNYWMNEMNHTNRQVVKIENSNEIVYILYGRDDEKNIWIQECLSSNGKIEECIIHSFGMYMNVSKIHLRLQDGILLQEKSYSMIKWANNNEMLLAKKVVEESTHSYMNLMLD